MTPKQRLQTLSDQSLTDPSCRPTGCAVGTRPAYPAFQAGGLSFRPEIDTAFNGRIAWKPSKSSLACHL